MLTFNRFVFYDMKVLKQLNLPPETRLSLCDENGDLERARKPWELLPAGHKMGTPEPLFNELVNMLFYYCHHSFCPLSLLWYFLFILLTTHQDLSFPSLSFFSSVQRDEDVEFFREKFAGSQADRVVKAEAEAKKIVEQLKEAKISGFHSFFYCDYHL